MVHKLWCDVVTHHWACTCGLIDNKKESQAIENYREVPIVGRSRIVLFDESVLASGFVEGDL